MLAPNSKAQTNHHTVNHHRLRSNAKRNGNLTWRRYHGGIYPAQCPLVIAPYIYSGSSSKVKQGGCTRKGYAVRFPMLRIDRDAKRRTLAVLTHSLIFSE